MVYKQCEHTSCYSSITLQRIRPLVCWPGRNCSGLALGLPSVWTASVQVTWGGECSNPRQGCWFRSWRPGPSNGHSKASGSHDATGIDGTPLRSPCGWLSGPLPEICMRLLTVGFCLSFFLAPLICPQCKYWGGNHWGEERIRNEGGKRTWRPNFPPGL